MQVTQKLQSNRIVATAIEVQHAYSKDGGAYRAASISYYAFLSLIPLILLGLAVAGFILGANPLAIDDWSSRISNSVPGLEGLVGKSIDAIVDARKSGGLLGLAALVWTGLAVFQAAEHSVESIAGTNAKHSFFVEKLKSLLALIALGVLGLAGIAAGAVAGSFEASGVIGFGISALAVALGFLLDFVLFLAAYRLFGRAGGWTTSTVIPGALLGAFAWGAFKFVGVWLASRSADNASATYGALASVIAVLLLLHIGSRIFLYGAELIQVLNRNKSPLDLPQ
ncbi:MAG: YihY/virulence factor BrkB family protein [Actinomycetota bacterium]